MTPEEHIAVPPPAGGDVNAAPGGGTAADSVVAASAVAIGSRAGVAHDASGYGADERDVKVAVATFAVARARAAQQDALAPGNPQGEAMQFGVALCSRHQPDEGVIKPELRPAARPTRACLRRCKLFDDGLIVSSASGSQDLP